MSAGWSLLVLIGTIATMAGSAWLLISNRDKKATGERMDHEFDGIEEFDNPLPAWWVTLFFVTIIFGAGYVAYYPALGNLPGAGEWSSAKEWQYRVDQHELRYAPLYEELAAQSPDELIKQPRAMQIGRRLYLNNCSTCHGVTAQGSVGFPNLTDEEWIWGAEFDNIKSGIINGRAANMPAWGEVLSEQQIREVVDFVKFLSRGDTQAAASQPGQTHYVTYCVACHGAQGQGNTLVGGTPLNNDIWLYGGDDAAITASIVNGRMGNMPAQGPIVGEEKAHVLAAYIYSLRTKAQSKAP